jgi:hypothetical protein
MDRSTQIKQALCHWIERNAMRFTQLSDKIWQTRIVLSRILFSKLQADFLAEEGFHITWELAA